MPGRPPIPIDVHLARGTYVKSRHSGKLASPAKRLGKPPAWLAGVMPALWESAERERLEAEASRLVVDELEPQPHGGSLKRRRVDWQALGLEMKPPPAWFAAAMIGEWVRLSKLPHIRAAHAAAVEQACVLYGRFVADAVGIRAMTASERATMHSTYMQLACTPASAAKVPAEAPAAADDPWAQFG